MIKNIIFDFGGVIVTLGHQQALEAFQALGLTNAAELMDAYTQGGIFGDLEVGNITAEEFRQQLIMLVGHDISYEECRQTWLKYHSDLPQRNLDLLRQLRAEGYKLVLLSNTNPYMMSWAESPAFDGKGHPLSDYFDATYKSYQVKMMKPDPRFFKHVLNMEHLEPEETLFVDDGPRNIEVASELGIHTFCPKNGSDWTSEIRMYL